jgi:PST family polysaccharide transporter
MLSRIVGTPDRYRTTYLRLIGNVSLVSAPAVAFLIPTADWLIALILGPQWTGAARIFSVLGAVGLVQPALSATGWLFISQGRTRDMFRWGVLGSALSIASFIIGLPWGGVGVATSYAVSILLVQTPLLFYFVGRQGAVRTGDLFRVLAVPLATATSVLAAVAGFRYAVPVSSNVTGLFYSGAVALLAGALVLSAHRAGRAAVKELVETTLTLARGGVPRSESEAA